MNERIKILGQEAERLSTQERLELVDYILASVQGVSPDVDAAWDREIASRAAAYDRGEFQTQDADEVIEEARRALKR